MNTDTPRTDAIDTYQPFIVSEPKYNAMAELCRTLERELTAEQEKVKRLREALRGVIAAEFDQLGERVKAARATLEATK